MEPLDTAHAELNRIAADLKALPSPPATEQDVRLKVIDPILQSVLGWPPAEMFAEEHARGGFVDYKLCVDARARLVVEAKRDARQLGVEGRRAGQAFKLSGAVFNTEASKEGISQAIDYCGRKSAELACVTNGREWIVFRGNRLGDGRDVDDGMAFVFPSLDAIIESFKLFYELLSYSACRRFAFRAYFQEAEGRPIRLHDFRRAVRSPGQQRMLRFGSLAADIDRVMASFFERLTGDQDADMLAKCFVTSEESNQADRELARISEDLIGKIRDLNPGDAAQLAELVRFSKEHQRKQFVVLVGLKGAGKSTFIDRFFRFVLDPQLAEECVHIRVNLADADGAPSTVVGWLGQTLVKAAEAAVYGGDVPTFQELQGLFFGEYERLRKGPWAPLYTQDKQRFKVNFGARCERMRSENPHEYIKAILHNVVASRRKLPVLILDNADHHQLEFQEHVYQYARSLYESEVCMVLLPITDRTSWQMSRHGALQSFEHEAFYLPPPQIYRVIERRIEYLDTLAREHDPEKGRNYLFGKGIQLDIENLRGFVSTLQRVFVEKTRFARIIANLSNSDVRRALRIARHVVASPHLRVEDLLKAYVAGSGQAMQEKHLRRALILGRYETFHAEHSEFVHNIFDLVDGSEASPLLGVRLLQLLRDVPKQDVADRFITVDQVLEYCQAIGVEPQETIQWLDALLKRGLCVSYDPTVTEADEARQIMIQPSGLQHLWWSMREWDYLGAMSDVTPLTDPLIHQQLSDLSDGGLSGAWAQRIAVFGQFLLDADARCVLASNHEAMRGQARVRSTLEATVRDLRPYLPR